MAASSWVSPRSPHGAGAINREDLRNELVFFAQSSVAPLLEESFARLSERVATKVVESIAFAENLRPMYVGMDELHDVRVTSLAFPEEPLTARSDQEKLPWQIEKMQQLDRQEVQGGSRTSANIQRSNTGLSMTYSSHSDPVPRRRCGGSGGSRSGGSKSGGSKREARESPGWSLKHLPPRVQLEKDLSQQGDSDQEADFVVQEEETFVDKSPKRAWSSPTPYRGRSGDSSGTFRQLRLREEQEDQSAGEPLVTDDGLGIPVLAKQSKNRTFYDRCRRLVLSSAFEHAIGFLVVLNAASLGSATDYWSRHPRQDSHPFIFEALEVFFCCVFTLEWLLRVFVHGSTFFTMEGRRWHLFDTMMLTCQLLEQGIQQYCVVNLSILRLLRILRVVRIARLVRVLHLVDELRVIVRSLVNSSHTLVWSFVLLGITVYIFSVAFLRIVLDAGDTPHQDEIHYYFASLYRSCLTMFECIVGGQSWDVVVAPLMEDISPFLGILFCIYISACLFAMMNLLTGIFVENAMRTVREDKDMTSAAKIRDLFLVREHSGLNEEDDSHEEITWETFSSKLETAAMQEYFKQINVEISEARNLFDLIDADGSGSVDSKEIVDGCLKLRGPARALEMAILMKESAKTYEQVSIFHNVATKELRDIREEISRLSNLGR